MSVIYRFTLRELEAAFVARTENGWREVDAIAEGDGLWVLCPRCFRKNAGAIGTHRLLHWFEGKVPDDVGPGPGRWKPHGVGLDDLTFVPGKNSCSVAVGKHFHGYVRAGGYDVDKEGPE